MPTTQKIDIFKTHIAVNKQYVGGSTRSETNAQQLKKIYKLSSNENMLGTSPEALLSIKKNIHQLHEYNYENDLKFRHALCDHFQQSLTPDQFITGNGCMELLELFVRGFADPGYECILSSPTFMAYKNFAEIQGAKVIDVPLKAGSFELDIEGILHVINPNTRLLFLTNPNNPTGTFIPKSVTDALIEQIPSHVIIVYDEVYFHYVTTTDYARAIDYIKQGKNVIGLHSFSKAYGMAGIRLGYAFSTPEIAGYLNRIRRPFMIGTLTMEAGIAALKDHAHIKKTQELIAREKQWLYTQLNMLGISYWKSQANFILFNSPLLPTMMAEKCLELGIMVRSGEVFLAPDCVRVTIGTREANKAFIDAMEEILSTLSKTLITKKNNHY